MYKIFEFKTHSLFIRKKTYKMFLKTNGTGHCAKFRYDAMTEKHIFVKYKLTYATSIVTDFHLISIDRYR